MCISSGTRTKDLPWDRGVVPTCTKWIEAQGMDSSVETKMTCVGHYEMKPPIYKKFIQMYTY